MKWYKDIGMRCVAYFVIGLIIEALVLFLTCSCTTTQYVPIETVRTEVINQHDTITIQDTTKIESHTIIREADSAEIERLTKEYGFKLDKAQKTILVLRKEIEQEKSKVKESHTGTSDRTSIVQIPYPVERKLTKWESFCIDYGKVMVGGTVVAILAIVLAIVLWIRKRFPRARTL